MKCEHIRDLLSPYMDEMTSEKENKAVEAHIAVCSQCRGELEQLKMVCQMLHGLETPILPEKFTQDFHKRMMQEQTRILMPREVKSPRKSGWLAAGVAGLALAIGVYASSVLPLGTMVASWQDQEDKEVHKSNVVIEDVINSIKVQWANDNKGLDDETVVPDGGSEENLNPQEEQPQEKPPVTTNEASAPSKSTPVQEAPSKAEVKIAQEYSTKIQVDSIKDSTDGIMRLAQADEMEYISPPGGAIFQAMTDVNGKQITLRVKSDQLDKVLADLAAIGKTAAPIKNDIELTEEYAKVQKQINSLQQQADELSAQEKTTAAEQAKLGELKNSLEDWNAKKAQLDKQLDMVTLKIYLQEDVKP